MKLSNEDRSLIHDVLNLCGLKQRELAKAMDMAPSALSDALRNGGQRTISEQRRDILFEELEKAIRQKRATAQGRIRLRLQDLEQDLLELRDSQESTGLRTIIPGTVLPATMSARYRHIGERELLARLFGTGGLHIRHFAPMMGATSLADRLEAEAAKRRSDEGRWRVVRLPSPAKATSSVFAVSFLEAVTESRDVSSRIASMPNPVTEAKHALEDWALARIDAAGSESVRTLVIIDRLDDWIAACLSAGEGEPEQGAKLVDYLLELLVACNGSILQRRLSVLVTMREMPFTLQENSVGGLVSRFIQRASVVSVGRLDELGISELAVRMGLDLDIEEVQEIVSHTNGNLFLSHAWLYLSVHGLPKDRIVAFCRQSVEVRSTATNVPGGEKIAVSMMRLRDSVTDGYLAYVRLLSDQPDAKPDLDRSATIIARLVSEPPREVLVQGDLHLRPIQWLERNGIISFDQGPGLFRFVLAHLASRLNGEVKP